MNLTDMNTSRPQLPRGNKLFLPKIEYGKFTKETQLSGKKLNSNSTISGEKSSKDFGHEQAAPLLNSKNNMSSFTRFSVLPPIQKSFQAARRLSHTRPLSSVLFSPAMGSSAASNGADADQNEADRVRLCGDAVFQNQPSRCSDYASRNTLQIVGNTALKTSKHSRVLLRGVPRRSYSRPDFTNDEYACQYCEEALLKRTRSRLTNGDKISERWKSSHPHQSAKESPLAHYLQPPNSENLGLQNNNRGKDEIDVTLSRNEVVLIGPKRKNSTNCRLLVNAPKARPVSRCEINVDLSDGETDATQRMEQDETPIPMIEVHPPKTETSSEDNITRGKDRRPLTAARLQLLVNSIDSAKGELPNGSSEVPYTSVREKRRRSALCRNNSKQVDDFLLVHNLRDLGLL